MYVYKGTKRKDLHVNERIDRFDGEQILLCAF